MVVFIEARTEPSPQDECTSRSLTGGNARWASGQSARTALRDSSPLGWAEISHPFHPLRGQRFEVLKERRVAGVDTLILRELERGTFSVPREWTDWADLSPYDSLALPPRRLAGDSLFTLAALLEELPTSCPAASGQGPQKRIDK